MMNIEEEFKPFVADYHMHLIDLGHDEGLQFTNKKLDDLKRILSSIYLEKTFDDRKEVNNSMISLAAILAKDVKMYNDVCEKEGEDNMCEVLDRRDARVRAEAIAEINKELEAEREKNQQIIAQKDKLIAELQAQLSKRV